MNAIRISKLLDFISYICIIAMIGLYVFNRPSIEITLIILLGIALIRMLSSNLKANYYSKFYKNLNDENDILRDKIERLENENK